MREELLALRRAMAEAGVDVYIVPTDDFHGSEYTGAYFHCRAWLTGFTGSAGTAVVTKDWAGLWTDGRYFLQAADQLAGSGFTLMKQREKGVPEIPEWLEKNLEEGMVLGFDGRSMTSGNGKRYTAVAEKKGATVRFDLDLVGLCWAGRPPMSEAPVWALPEENAGRSRSEKIAALRAAIKKEGADAHLLCSLDDLAWLLNIRGDDVPCCPVVLADAYITDEAFILFIDERKFSPALRSALEAEGICFRPYLSLYDFLPTVPAGTKLLLSPDKANYAILKGLPAGVTVLEKEDPTLIPKAAKNPAEQDGERLAHIKDGAALTRFMKWLREHVGREPITEISAAKKLLEFRAEMPGFLGESFDPIMGYGPHGAIVHYKAEPETDAALQAEGFFLCDTGGHYREGTTDVTRTFVLGPITEEMKYHYTLVLKGHLGLGAAVFPRGICGLQIDYAARRPLWEAGLNYNHGTGHGVGHILNVHEGPQRINSNYQKARTEGEIFLPGMVTSDEPGLYFEGKYGIRLENLMLCVEKQKTDFGSFLGFEMLTMCPFEREAILPELLSEAERKALNDYHETVYKKLSPYYNEEERLWLKEACAPI